eukprot:NODE_342_length_10579_cov_0.629389.p5 type:complete len:102 gc:universal NODE_342_length_10579_cov_0.629389:1375-1680(+)
MSQAESFQFSVSEKSQNKPNGLYKPSPREMVHHDYQTATRERKKAEGGYGALNCSKLTLGYSTCCFCVVSVIIIIVIIIAVSSSRAATIKSTVTSNSKTRH